MNIKLIENYLRRVALTNRDGVNVDCLNIDSQFGMGFMIPEIHLSTEEYALYKACVTRSKRVKLNRAKKRKKQHGTKE